MFNGTIRPHQLNGYCDGTKQDGLPQVLSYVSTDFKTWEYLGEQWKGDGGSMEGRRCELIHFRVGLDDTTRLRRYTNGYGADVCQARLV